MSSVRSAAILYFIVNPKERCYRDDVKELMCHLITLQNASAAAPVPAAVTWGPRRGGVGAVSRSSAAQRFGFWAGRSFPAEPGASRRSIQPVGVAWC